VAKTNVATAMANAVEHFQIDSALGLDDAKNAANSWASMARHWNDDPARDTLRQEGR